MDFVFEWVHGERCVRLGAHPATDLVYSEAVTRGWGNQATKNRGSPYGSLENTLQLIEKCFSWGAKRPFVRYAGLDRYAGFKHYAASSYRYDNRTGPTYRAILFGRRSSVTLTPA